MTPRRRAAGRNTLTALLLLAALGAAALVLPVRSAAHPVCTIDVWIYRDPRSAPDGAAVGYELRFEELVNNPGGVVLFATLPADPLLFVPGSGRWLDCPTQSCSIDPDGTLRVDAFPIGPLERVSFLFELTLQPGLRGGEVCEQGQTSVRAGGAMVDCPSPTSDPEVPLSAEPTCLLVDDAVPSCQIVPTVDPPVLAGCAGEAATLSALGSAATGCSGGALTYQWTRDGVALSGAVLPEHTIPASEPPSGASYRVLVGCAADPACRTLSAPTFVALLGPGDVVIDEPACAGTALLATVPDGATCSIDCGNGVPPSGSCTASCTYATAGTYELVATATDAGGCRRVERRDVAIVAAPVACIPPIAPVCESLPQGPTRTTLPNCSLPGLTSAWTTSLGTLDDPAAATPRLLLPDVSVPTTVDLALVTSATGCSTQGSTAGSFELLPAPTPAFEVSPFTPCPAIDAVFDATAAGTAGPYRFDWDFGDGGNASGATVAHRYATPGTYTVEMVATDTASGCASTVSATVTVAPTCCASSLPPVDPVLAWKGPGRNDVTLVWDPIPQATEGYSTWLAFTKRAIPDARAPGSGAVSRQCTSPLPTCRINGAIFGAPGEVRFYQVRAVCDGAEGP